MKNSFVDNKFRFLKYNCCLYSNKFWFHKIKISIFVYFLFMVSNYQFASINIKYIFEILHKSVKVTEKDGYLYGTTYQSIRTIISQGKLCLIDCKPEVTFQNLLRHPTFFFRNRFSFFLNLFLSEKDCKLNFNWLSMQIWHCPIRSSTLRRFVAPRFNQGEMRSVSSS